jgi:hypothetical protein
VQKRRGINGHAANPCAERVTEIEGGDVYAAQSYRRRDPSGDERTLNATVGTLVPVKQASSLEADYSAALYIRGLHDHRCDRIGMRDQRDMARVQLDGLGFHPIGHESLQFRVDRSVFLGNLVPRRL